MLAARADCARAAAEVGTALAALDAGEGGPALRAIGSALEALERAKLSLRCAPCGYAGGSGRP